MKTEFSAGVIVYFNEIINDRPARLYLLLNYRKGYWDLAKGKLEAGETNLQAAIRELKEETGLTATIHSGFEQSLSYIFKNYSGDLVDKTVTYFVGQASTKEVVISSEHLSFKWLPIKEALQELTYMNSQQIVSLADHFVENLERHRTSDSSSE